MTQLELEKLYDDFNAIYTLAKLKTMTLEQYTNLNKSDSFCYWLEAITSELGSIWGGSSYKFGIYKQHNVKTDNRKGYLTNGGYAWVGKYGNSVDTAFEKIKSIIIDICEASQNGRFEDIDKLDLGEAYKWKIAFLYSNRKLIGIFNPDNLRTVASLKAMEADQYATISAMHRFLISIKPDPKSILEYSYELWNESLTHNVAKYWLYAPGENAHRWGEFYDNGIMALGWNNLGDLTQYKNKKDIGAAMKMAHNTTTNHMNINAAKYDFCHKIREGDFIFVKHGKNKIIGYGVVASEYYYDDSSENYVHRRKVDWKEKGNWDINHNMIKTLTNITNRKIINDIKVLFNLNNITKTPNMKLDIALNTILCGPPGTGKTYRLQNEYAKKFTDEEYILTKEEYSINTIKDLRWWDVVALVLYETDKVQIKDIWNNDYIRIRASFSKNNTVKSTISRRLQEHDKNLDSKITVKCEPLVCVKHENGYWSVDKKMLEESMPELIEKIEKINKYEPRQIVSRRYKFITFHQKYSYEDFIIGITPVLNNEEGDGNESTLKFKQKYGIFYNCCEEAIKLAGFESFDDCYHKTPKERIEMFEKARPYAIFIDEINRANISAVFGELISCMEDDKRIGSENELWVELPLDGGAFGVPSNLYIIGTLNTADRSIALIDVALRRRFEFIRMLPVYDIIPEWARETLKKINEEIFKLKKSTDFFIGHSFFINKSENDLNKIFDNKIIPLLYEYFQNNTDRVKAVLEAANIDVSENNHILEFIKIK